MGPPENDMNGTETYGGYKSRDSVQDIWGPRTPYKHEWPTRVDSHIIEEPEKWVQSGCVLCSNGCGIDIGVKNGKVVGVRGRATDRVNKGRLGPKGMNAWTTIHHKDRLLHPLIRKEGKLVQATWEEAMSLIVKKSRETIRRLTPHGIAFYTSGQLFLEEYYALAMVGKAGLNTLHMDGNTRLCTATAAASMRESFGSDGQPGSYTDIDFTHCIFMVGHNMSATQTVLWSRILDRLAGPQPPKLIVVDPRLSDSAKEATVHLAPRVGTNVALLNGIQHLLFKNDQIHKFAYERCVGIEELREKVHDYTPEYVEEITGVPAAKIVEAATIIGTTRTMLSTALQGVYQSNQATAAACQINNINLLRGCIGKKGSGIYQMNGQPTAQNNRETGCDGEFPGFRNKENHQHMQELADIWNIDINKVPHWNEPTHVQNILNYIAHGTVEMLWVSGTNPLVSLPNLNRMRELFTKESLFLICQDIFLSETAAIADVVLPAAQWGEKTGCFTNVDRTVHISHKAVDPPGEARSDFDIFVDYARRMDFRDKDGNLLIPWNKPEDGFKAWQQLSKGRPCDYSGMSYEMLTGGSGIQWPCNDEYPEGKERLFDDGVFFTDASVCENFGHDLETGAPFSKAEYESWNPAGKAILKSCHYFPPLEATTPEYPLNLSTGRNVYHFHTRTKTGRSKPLQDAFSEPTIQISHEDAKELDIAQGEEVVVYSPRGSVQMKVDIGKPIKGQTFIFFHFGYWDKKDEKSRAANELTLQRWDPVSKQPIFKGGAIRIEKVTDGKVHAQQGQTKAEQLVTKKRPEAFEVSDDSKRERHLTLWLGAAFESISVLIELYTAILPSLIHDLEIHAGLSIMKKIAVHTKEILEPFAKHYNSNQKYGREVSENLRKALFPSTELDAGTYEALVTLNSLHIFLANIEGHLIGLKPVSAALWDGDFVAALAEVQNDILRTQRWVRYQMTVRAPQTLIVPSISLIHGERNWSEDQISHLHDHQQGHENGHEHTNGMNGSTNGHTNGRSNGSTNGYSEDHAKRIAVEHT